MWNVEISAFGYVENIDVEAGTLAGAVHKALEELGVADNDEASVVLKISGEAEPSDDIESQQRDLQPKRKKDGSLRDA